jgi:hypothetical protein
MQTSHKEKMKNSKRNLYALHRLIWRGFVHPSPRQTVMFGPRYITAHKNGMEILIKFSHDFSRWTMRCGLGSNCPLNPLIPRTIAAHPEMRIYTRHRTDSD